MDFHQRAQAAAASILSSSSSSSQNLTPPEVLARSLTNNDRPSIESAIKSYMSLCAARSLSATSTDKDATTMNNKNGTNNNNKCTFVESKAGAARASLLCARSMSKLLNTFIVPSSENDKEDEDDDDVTTPMEREVIRILWNGMIRNEAGPKKPCKYLGKRSLCHVYPLLLSQIIDHDHDAPKKLLPDENEVDRREVETFFSEFGTLLSRATNRKGEDDIAAAASTSTEKEEEEEEDDDSRLLWDLDGGEAELKRRRRRRDVKATACRERISSVGGEISSMVTNSGGGGGVVIEELPDE